MKTLSFFHPKSLPVQILFLSFFFIALISFDAQSASINWVGANGNSGSRWHEASNWSSRTVPTSNDDVVIPNVKNAPVITTAAACNSITINTGASLTINSGGNLTVSGNWTNNGTFTQNSGTVTFGGDASVDLGGEANTTFTSLKVNKGNGQSAEVHLKGKGTVEVKSALIIDNGLMKIDTGGALNLSGTAAAPTSGIALNGGTFTINGNITPLSGTTINITSSKNWSQITNGSGTNGLPSLLDNITVSGSATLTVNIADAVCNTIVVGGADGNNGQAIAILKFNSNTALNVSGDFTLGYSSKKKGTLDMASGGTLKVGGALTSPYLETWTQGSGTIEYNGAAQTVYATTYNNLTLSGSGTKTMSSTRIINGTLSLKGTATVSASPSYGTSATLEYAGSSQQTTTNIEFPLSVTTLNLKIANTNGVLLHSARTIKNLDITAGTFNAQSNSLTVNGNWNVDGIYTQSGATTIFSGTTTHTLSGAGYSQFNNLTTTGETINAGSHDIRIASNFTHSSGTFNEQISTITLNGSADQSLSASSPSFYNLIINKSGGNLSTTRVWTVSNDFELKAGTLQPAANSSFKNITLSGGTFTAPTGSITVSGNWTKNSGTFAAGIGTVTFNGAAQTISGATTFNHLTVAGTDTKTIASSASVTVEGNLTVNNNSTLKIESTGASATGSLIVKGSATVNGTVSVQRYLPSENWHLISSPVSGLTLNDFATANNIQLDAATNTRDIGPYEESSDKWDYTVQSSNFEAAKGYSTERTLNAGAGVATFTGNGIYTGSKSIGISRSTTGYGWNCIGNPYTSAILVTNTGSFLTVNADQLDPAHAHLYVWNNGTGQYDQISNSTTNSYIAVGQGFIVKAKDGGGSINFTKDMQSHQNGTTFKDAEIPWPTITLNAETSDSRSHTVVNFNEAMTTGLDPTYDGGMFKANPKLSIYTKLVGERLPVDFGVQSLPLNESYSYRIPVGVDVPSGGEISFSAEAMNLVGYKVVLEDALTNQLTPMGNEGEGYTTVVPANTTGAGRFYLRVSSSLTGTEALAKPEFSVFLRDRNIIVNGDAGEQTVFTLCNIEGKQFSQQKATHRNQNIVNAQSLPAGVYLLRIDEPNRHQVAKVMIAQ